MIYQTPWYVEGEFMGFMELFDGNTFRDEASGEGEK